MQYEYIYTYFGPASSYRSHHSRISDLASRRRSLPIEIQNLTVAPEVPGFPGTVRMSAFAEVNNFACRRGFRNFEITATGKTRFERVANRRNHFNKNDLAVRGSSCDFLLGPRRERMWWRRFLASSTLHLDMEQTEHLNILLQQILQRSQQLLRQRRRVSVSGEQGPLSRGTGEARRPAALVGQAAGAERRRGNDLLVQRAHRTMAYFTQFFWIL